MEDVNLSAESKHQLCFYAITLLITSFFTTSLGHDVGGSRV